MWFADVEEENQAYSSAKCEEKHEDGSTCMPSWDGFMFVCLDRIIRERDGV